MMKKILLFHFVKRKRKFSKKNVYFLQIFLENVFFNYLILNETIKICDYIIQ